VTGVRGPARVDELPAFFTQGACRGADPELFFLGPGQNPDEAKAICGGCTVRRRCLSWALETRTEFGIWGGATPEERIAMRPKGRRP
jgi:WhiB family transcriptional regulator, redox-sensing transcriptional regulator